MEFVLIFVNTFILIFGLLHVFGYTGGKSGPFCKKGFRRKLMVSASQALVVSLVVKLMIF
ncbi:hypothetical protein [Paenibacillus turpanensis]|uniref:hypothetical protein n=1 Tax=Paenibacillus turpanensis TaxID=2689078 RepID=UPI00140C627E|nr:hypothetical protein [Paenibacillus turpanensis]